MFRPNFAIKGFFALKSNHPAQSNPQSLTLPTPQHLLNRSKHNLQQKRISPQDHYLTTRGQY